MDQRPDRAYGQVPIKDLELLKQATGRVLERPGRGHRQVQRQGATQADHPQLDESVEVWSSGGVDHIHCD